MVEVLRRVLCQAVGQLPGCKLRFLKIIRARARRSADDKDHDVLGPFWGRLLIETTQKSSNLRVSTLAWLARSAPNYPVHAKPQRGHLEI